MNNIFDSEENVLVSAREVLESGIFKDGAQRDAYWSLLNNYDNLLRQMKKIVKISDKTQKEFKMLMAQLDTLSTVDPLTDLYNRRYFNQELEREWESARKEQRAFSLIMMDIDYFKKYNDAYGHLQGDECLKSVAGIIKDTVERHEDTVVRFGGEEFMLILPDTEKSRASALAEEIRQNIYNANIEHRASSIDDRLTVSFAHATAIPKEGETPEDFIDRLDKALYKAKEQGRNCVFCG